MNLCCRNYSVDHCDLQMVTCFLGSACERIARCAALLAHALIDQTSDWRTVDTAEFLPANTSLIVNLGTSSSSPGFVSTTRASAYPIAFCVAEFSLAPSSRILKRQNFFAISSWRLPMDWNLLNYNSRVCILSASSCARKSFSVAGS